MPTRRNVVLGAAGLTLGAPCRAIIGGAPDGSPPDSPVNRVDPNHTTSPFAGVGSLSVERPGKGTSTYTASALDARHVITAAHVVAGVNAPDVRFNLNYGSDLSHRIEAEAIAIHPEFGASRPNPKSGVAHDDLAILRLHESMPFGVPFYPIQRRPVAPHTVVTLVGYGAGGDGVQGSGIAPSPSVKRIGRNVIDAAFRDEAGSDVVEVYVFDFDGPEGSGNRLGGATLGNHIEATLASGDSGSPALVPGPQGSWQLVGVNTFVVPGSGNQQRFGGLGGGILLYPYVGWVDSVLAAAA